MRQTAMTFSGHTFTFTEADVLTATRGVAPETITRYYVELHGKRYPPKQVIRLVTRTRKRFNSANARSAMRTVKDVAKRIQHELGLSRAVSVRIANKLNELAKTVAWATPVADGRPRRRPARRKIHKGKR